MPESLDFKGFFKSIVNRMSTFPGLFVLGIISVGDVECCVGRRHTAREVSEFAVLSIWFTVE